MTYELLGMQNLSLGEKNNHHLILRRKNGTELECILAIQNPQNFVLYRISSHLGGKWISKKEGSREVVVLCGEK